MGSNSGNIIKMLTPPTWWGQRWRDGLYCGNGFVGANVYGGVMQERILINRHDNNWHGSVKIMPDIADNLPRVRQLIKDNQNMHAQSVLANALASKKYNPSQQFPLPIGELLIKMNHSGDVKDYFRQLDMATAEASVHYVIGKTTFARRTFVSRDDSSVVFNITRRGNTNISATISAGAVAENSNLTKQRKNVFPMQFECQCLDNYMYYAMANDDGTDFGFVAKFITRDGMLKCNEDSIAIENSSNLTVILLTFSGANRQKMWKQLKSQLFFMKSPYEQLLRTNATLHGRLYNSCKVSIDSSESCSLDKLLLECYEGNLSNQLLLQLYNYGRYVFICGGGVDARRLVPCGLWTGSYYADKSSISYDGQMQMSYLHALQGGLTKNIEDNFALHEKLLNDYQTNAVRLYGCNGAMIPAICAPNTGRLGTNDIYALHEVCCGGWLMNFYYKYAIAQSTNKFLKTRLLPFMLEVASFYDEYITFDDGIAVISPSPLPMRVGDSSDILERPVVAVNSAMDVAIIKQFYNNLIEACTICKVKIDKIDTWRDLLNALPVPQLTSENILKEFLSGSTSVDYSGNSIGTLYPVFYGEEVDSLSDRDIIGQYISTADKKLDNCANSNSYYMAILSSVYATLGHADKALHCLNNCIKGCSCSNLAMVDTDWRDMGLCGDNIWTAVQLQSNLVMVNTIQQMLMQSHGNTIHIMPTLPRQWKDIIVENMVASNGIIVSFNMNGKRGNLTVELLSKQDCSIKLYLPRFVRKMHKNSKNIELINQGNVKVVMLSLLGGKSATIEMLTSAR